MQYQERKVVERLTKEGTSREDGGDERVVGTGQLFLAGVDELNED